MNGPQPDPYAILGLSRRATHDEIGRAYRALLRAHHPDTRRPTDASRSAVSDAVLQQVLATHAVLGDPARRADYDRYTTPRQRTGDVPTAPSRVRQPPPIRVGPVRWHR